MSNHTYFEEQLPFYIAGNLAVEEQAVLEEHLTTCAVCQTNLDHWQALASVVQLRASNRVNQLPALDLGNLPVPLPQVNGNYAVPVPKKNTQPIRVYNETVPHPRAMVKPQWFTISAAVLALMMLGGLISLSYLPQSLSLVQEDAPLSFADLPPITIENAAQLTEIEHLGNGMVNDVAWSPDGKTMAVAGSSAVWLFNPATPELEPVLLPVKNDDLYVIAFSKDGSWLASGGLNGIIYIWDAHTFAPMPSIQTSAMRIMALDFSADSTFLASGGGEWDDTNGIIEIWTVSSGEKTLALTDTDGQIRHLVFSPDGKWLALASHNSFPDEGEDRSYSVKLWDVATGQKIATVHESTTAFVNGLAFSPDSLTLAANEKNWILLWDVSQPEQPIKINTPGTIDNFGLAFSPDGTQIAAGRVLDLSQDGGVRIMVYEVKTGDLLLTLPIPHYSNWFSEIAGLSFSPDGETIAAVVRSDVYLWDAQSGISIPLNSNFDTSIMHMSLADNATLVTANLNAEVSLWNLENGEKLDIELPDIPQFGNIALSQDGTLLALSGGDNRIITTLMVQNLLTGEILHQFEPITQHYIGVSELVFIPDNRLIVSFGQGPQIWNMETGEENIQLELDPEDEFSPRANYLSALVSTNGEILTTVVNNNRIGLWNIETGIKFQTLSGNTDEINAIALSRDGLIFASVSDDNTLRLWNLKTGDITYMLNEPDARILAFSPDGNLLVAVVNDRMHIWDTVNGSKIAVITTPWINNLIFSQDGRYIVTGGGDGVVRMWGVPNR